MNVKAKRGISLNINTLAKKLGLVAIFCIMNKKIKIGSELPK